MSQQSCSACNDLREYAPEFVLNGTTDSVGENLKNDDGLSNASGHSDCDDLLDVNDCLIGNMLDELDNYDVCDWKEFMTAFVGNLYETIKAMVYSTCGQWCAINTMFNGQTFSIGENTDGDAYVVAGKGVSFLLPHASSERTSDVQLLYIAGGLVRGTGSFDFFNNNFTDEQACGNFDNGSTYRKSQARLGNPVWGHSYGDGVFPSSGGELICELRIKKSAFPQIKAFYQGFGQETNGGAYSVRALVFDAGYYAYGQHGPCNSDGSPAASGYDSGHLVPAGWIYIQIRQSSIINFSMVEGRQYSPYWLMGMRMNPDEIEC